MEKDYFDEIDDAVVLQAATQVEPHDDRPTKRQRIGDTDAELVRLQQALQEAQAALEAKQGEIAFMRRTKQSEQDSLKKELQAQLTKNQTLETSIQQMKSAFKLDLERANTARIFAAQESQVAARRSKLHQTSIQHSQGRNATRTPSPRKKSVSPVLARARKNATEAFAGFNNAFATNDGHTKPLDHVNGNATLDNDMAMIDIASQAEPIDYDAQQSLIGQVFSQSTAKRDAILTYILNHAYQSITTQETSSTFYSILNCQLPLGSPPEEKAEKDGLAQRIMTSLSCEPCHDFTHSFAASLLDLTQWLADRVINGRNTFTTTLIQCLALMTALSQIFRTEVVEALLTSASIDEDVQLTSIICRLVLASCAALPTAKQKELERAAEPKTRQKMAIEQEQSSSSILEELLVNLVELLSALSFAIDESCIPKMETVLSHSPSVLLVLLDATNPPAVLKATVEWCLILTAEEEFFPLLFSSTQNPRLPQINDAKVTLVDRLASQLAVRNEAMSFEESANYHLSILHVLFGLCNMHKDTITLLGESATNLIPKLIARISTDTSLIYESNGRGIAGVYTDLIVRRCAASLQLLFILTNASSFGTRLNAAIPVYHGILQMFTISMGRIGGSDPPPWLEEPQRKELESYTVCAQILLDYLLTPGEQDEVYALYDDQDDENSQDEDEARIADEQMEELL